MKRRPRRQVLDINGEQSDSPRQRWQNKYEQIAADHPEENGGPSNPLTNLLEQYNSDSESDEAKPEGKQLNDQVNDFLKEIQLLAPEAPVADDASKANANSNAKECSARVPPTTEPSTLWQECFDDSTGYPYYWHVQTNQVTWEVPEEIRLLRERNEQDSPSRTSYSTQWVNFASNTYPQPQINIPEGMIPKEVVARNRNRQVSLQQNAQQSSQTQPNSWRNSVAKDDESDDGKIEMITSFGSDGSESEPSDNDSPVKKSPRESRAGREHPPKTKAANPPGKNSSHGKRSEASEKGQKIGPSLPAGIVPLIHGPENSIKSEQARERWPRKEAEEKSSLKSQLSPMQSQSSEASSAPRNHHSSYVDEACSTKKSSLSNNEKSENKERGASLGRELKFSLVPGYADDSDAEDGDAASPRKVAEPLFPIADFPAAAATATATIVAPDGTVKKVETKYTDSGSVKIFQYHSEKSGERTEEEIIKQMNQELESDVQENCCIEETRVVRLEQEPTTKPNIFLENLETPSKAFQRKRRIAFDVVINKNRCSDGENHASNKPETAPSPPTTTTTTTTLSGTETDRHGFGFVKESRNPEADDYPESTTDRKTNSPSSEKASKSSNISFVKGETMIATKQEQEETKVVREKSEAEITELKKTTETIMEKLKFLSEGGQPASAVQVMAIQLQTLLAAWEARDLKDKYLENWLSGTGRELGRLEEAAAPPGWDCQWDRSHKRYFYRNSSTGEAQWTYPEADIIGGTEEMELCTTPPPQGQEEPCIIESQSDKSQQVQPAASKESTEESLETKKFAANETNELSAPPPPQISSPSPPPPPRIYAEDIKKQGKKRRGSIQENVLETKKPDKTSETNAVSDTSKVGGKSVNPPLPPSPTKSAQPPLPPHPPIVPNPPNSEPLPPGVDPPDMPFTMTAPTIETTMLYTTSGPQTNPIYAATIGDPTLLGHHHTAALMQGQLMHYPTYHQHLHNQALIAAANRLTGQEAVQFMVDYSQVYANTQVIAKPPMKTHKESALGSALDSFYNDIATMENTRPEHEVEPALPSEPLPIAVPTIPPEVQVPPILTDSVLRERKKKKTKLGISKKQKQVSSMVAKWQKAQQHYEDND